jgi:hypothetical protein
MSTSVRLVQLEGPSVLSPLNFIPQLTVVGGLDDDLRARLVATLRALPAAAEPAWEGLVEAHGVVLDLHRENLRLLGLGHEVDVVVGAGDLPADGRPGTPAGMPTVADADPDEVLDGLRLSHDILVHGVTALKRSRIEYEEARADLDPFATTAFEQAAAALRRAEESDDAPARDATPSESLEELEGERDRLQAELAELDGGDLQPGGDALHRAERELDESPAEDDGDALAVRTLAEALRQAEQALDELDEARRSAGQDPAELVRRIEAARIQIERLESSAAPPVITAEDRQELEDAHDAVIEADFKVSATKLGGKAARQALDEAVAREEAILQRLGFPTYSAFALGLSAPGPDPETRVELESTRRELAELEAAYQESLTRGDDDPERVTLEAYRDDLRQDALALVDAAHDTVLAVITRLADALAEPGEQPAAATALRDVLAERGVDFAELGLSDDEVVDVARVWLADMQALEAQRADLEHELDTVQARLLVVAPAMGHGDGALDPVSRAQREVEAAEARLANHRQASDRVAELCGLLEEIEARLVDLGENISAQEALVAAASEGLAAGEARLASPDAGDAQIAEVESMEELFAGMSEEVDGTEWYLLTRLAGLRALSFAGSVPLVLDGALAGLDREDAHRVLDKVESMTDVVQVVYLGDDDAVVEWAALRGDDAAVITVGAGVG